MDARMTDYYYLAKTKEEEETLLDELSRLLESLYNVNPEVFEKTINSSVRHEVASLIIKDTKDKDRAAFIKDLLTKLKNRKTVKLTFAISPTLSFIEKIYTWLLSNVSEDIVIETSTDQSLLGGLIISYEGKYFEYSLAKTLRKI